MRETQINSKNTCRQGEILSRVSRKPLPASIIHLTKKGLIDRRYGALSEIHKHKLSLAKIGKKFSKEHRRKIGEGNKGKIMSSESREKIRIGLMNNKNSLGRKWSPEERKKHKPNSGQFKKGQPSVFKGKKRPNMSGENHPRWNGGSSFVPYPLGWNKTHKEQIRYRDNYKCQICGMPEIEQGKKLDVHHIDYDKANIEPNNLISLCHRCHTKTNVNREYWKNLFINRYLQHEAGQ